MKLNWRAGLAWFVITFLVHMAVASVVGPIRKDHYPQMYMVLHGVLMAVGVGLPSSFLFRGRFKVVDWVLVAAMALAFATLTAGLATLLTTASTLSVAWVSIIALFLGLVIGRGMVIGRLLRRYR